MTQSTLPYGQSFLSLVSSYILFYSIVFRNNVIQIFNCEKYKYLASIIFVYFIIQLLYTMQVNKKKIFIAYKYTLNQHKLGT